MVTETAYLCGECEKISITRLCHSVKMTSGQSGVGRDVVAGDTVLSSFFVICKATSQVTHSIEDCHL